MEHRPHAEHRSDRPTDRPSRRWGAPGNRRLAAPALLLALLLPIPGAASADEPGAANTCVNCHDQQRLPIALGHSFDEWRVSPHAANGVGCEKCHGGDPTASVADEAHRGVRATSDPESRVHPRHLATTCGACHEAELAAYADTVHAKQVQQSGTGATCMTCHGSMAASLPSPAEMGARCAVCHDEPLQARVALVMLAHTKNELHRTARLLEKARSSQPEWYAEATHRLQSLEGDYAALQLTWHTFHMKETLKESRAILKLVDLLDEEARLRLERGH